MKILVTIISAIVIFLGGFAVMQQGNQVVIYVGDPAGAMAGTSTCIPCNTICRDLKKYKTDQGRYIIGTQRQAFFRVVQARPGMSTPTIVYPGQRPLIGYRGEHETLVARHPLAERIKKR